MRELRAEGFSPWVGKAALGDFEKAMPTSIGTISADMFKLVVGVTSRAIAVC